MTKQRQKLIRLINIYINKPHIKMKGPLRYYLQRLNSGNNLKTSHLKTILPYLKWDMKMSEKQILHYFSDLIGTSKPSQPQVNNLEQFL